MLAYSHCCLLVKMKTLFMALVCVCCGTLAAVFFVINHTSLLCYSSLLQCPHLSYKSTLTNDHETDSFTSISPNTTTWPTLHLDWHDGKDVLVNIHIQKTGGSDFLAHVVTAKRDGERLCYSPNQHLKKAVGRKKNFVVCPVSRRVPPQPLKTSSGTYLPELWFAAEKTYGWVCGPHPLLAEMKTCLPKFLNKNYDKKRRDFHFMTLLRHPVSRYISEFLHVRRGATWTYGHQCGGHLITGKEMPACYPGFYEGKPWENVTLEQFMACDSNWARNRQTVMVADLEAVGCFRNTNLTASDRDHFMLQSAKENLEQFAFVGISEYMAESGLLFEHRFGVELDDPSMQKQLQYQHSGPVLVEVWKNASLYNRLAAINSLDMELYNYAMKLFTARLEQIGLTIDTGSLSKEIYLLRRNHSPNYYAKYSRMKNQGILTFH